MSNAMILTPLRFTSSPVVRVAVDGGGAADITISVTPGRNYWMSGDGRADGAEGVADLLEVIRAALAPTAPGITVRLDGFRVRFDVSGTLQILWTHSNTTMDPAALGFDGVDTAAASTLTGSVLPQGIFRAGAPTGYGRDQPVVVAGVARSIAGDVAGTFFGEGLPERSITFPALADSKVRAEAADPAEPNGTLDVAWKGAIAKAWPFRLYEDETRLAHGVYRARDIRRPYRQHARHPMYWTAAIESVLVDSWAGPLTDSLSDPWADWIVAYSAEDAAGVGPYSWPPSLGAGPTLSTSDAYSGGEPTAPLLEAGIGAGRVDGALIPGASGFSGAPFDWPSGAVHIRSLFRNAAEANGNRLWDWIGGGAIDRVYARWTSSTDLLVVWQDTGDGPVYSTTLVVPDGAWHLLDVVIDPTGGAGGVSRMRVYLDGAEIATVDHSVAIQPEGSGSLYLGQPPTLGPILFWGLRPATGIDLTTHQTHATAIGV